MTVRPIEPRGFSSADAQDYLGIGRRAFLEHIAPKCTPVKCGTKIIYDRTDLDAAWNVFKERALKEAAQEKTEQGGKWASNERVFTKKKAARDTKLTNTSTMNGFANVAFGILRQQRAG